MDIQNATLGELNKSLEERLVAFKGRDFKFVNSAREEINMILYSALKLDPLGVNAVIIEMAPDIDRECTDLPNNGNRDVLRRYLSKLGNSDLQSVVPFALVDHLPFPFEDYPDLWPGYRNIEAVAFESRNLAPVGIRLNLVRSNLGVYVLNDSWNVYLLPEEVQSIRLAQVPDNIFSQKLDRDSPHDLYRSHSTLEHYLAFSRFVAPIPNNQVRNRLLISRHQSPLGLRSNRYTANYDGVDRLSGFAVHITNNGPILYEFDNVVSPTIDENVAASLIIDSNQNGRIDGVTTYFGNDIIARLHEAQKPDYMPKPKPL